MPVNLEQLYAKSDKKREELKRSSEREESIKETLRNNLAHDSDMIRDAIINKIIMPQCERIMAKSNDDEEKVFKLWNIQYEECLRSLPLKGNMKVSTFFTGFWDDASKSHTFDAFEEAGKKKMFDELKDKILPLVLTDISDRSRSMAYVLTCTIPARELA